MNLVWDSTLDGLAKRFALLALADRASHQGECSSLGVNNLVRKTGIPRSTMFRVLRELETVDNLIQREEQTRANGSRKASRFWINVDLLAAMRRPDADKRDADEPINPFSVSTGHTPVPLRDGKGVPQRDDPRPDLGPLDPFSFSETEKTPETDGRIGSASEHQHLAARIVAGLDLRRCGPSPKQRGQITDAVASALARGVAPSVVAEYARGKALEADTVKYLVKAFTVEHLAADVAPTPAAPALASECGQCDARPGDPIAMRQTTDTTGRAVKCPNCHPHATGGAR